MVAGCGPKIAKLFLFILNFCVWAAGIVLISIGSWITARQQEYTDLFAEDTILIVTGITIGVGCFIFLVGFCGCCGALKEGTFLLKLYFFFMVLIILLEITAGILAFVFDDELEASMIEGMTYTITNTYPTTDASKESVDGIQNSFDCCGATGYADYANSLNFPSNLAVPESCCVDGASVSQCQTGTKGNPTFPTLVNSQGCVDASIDDIQDNYLIIGAVCLALLVFEIFTMVFACCVISGIDKGEYA
ncbi:CD151 antigen isoform X2 [Strongylocentrotus purpuratus]|uniref:Tetraspanin n=1 Tax=Strongylocentrotus purpuratus TaxID=7668 RepID=A0A7M7HCX2_STRPU|nr:CD151 antigen isoform X2 [Strongylocentrotus purpuratus]XP_030845566.1 CD151 antigen isoform X2 [Strongylocentrotus purpuratus]|eukprot:XP_011664079.1 PREDICTED: CD151 antigen [Strongylocentrotus purpuratus]